MWHNVYIDGSDNLLLHLEGIIKYVLPKPNEKFWINSSTDKNDTSEKGDFELTNTEDLLFIMLKHPRFQCFVTIIHVFVWKVLRSLLLTLLYLWTKYWIFNKAICSCEIYILTVSFSKIFLHIADLNFLPMKRLAQSILRCKFSLYIRPSKRAFEKYKPQGFNIFHFTVIKSWPQ